MGARRSWILLAFPALAACAGQIGGPAYVGASPMRAEVGDMRFVLRVLDDRAEAIRVSPMFPAKFDEVAERAQIAVARASGCHPAWVVGDPSVVEIGLSCGTKPAPKKPKRHHTACDVLKATGGRCG